MTREQPLNRPTVHVVSDNDAACLPYRELLPEMKVTFRPLVSATDRVDAYLHGDNECMVCDVLWPGVNGIELQRTLLAAGSALPVIFVSAHVEVAYVVEVIKAGAFDFLEKPVDGAHLQQKVQSALEHGRELRAPRSDAPHREKRLLQLSPREREIAVRVVAGRTSREISDELFVSVRTIENHRARISRKLNIHSTIELVHLLSNT
ncbi:LuxR C-terminal-related transcriptional regulator [Paraburkholderia bryophila]|uniref:response regulator transcription factor n=1 Tax=Paraburkholderia bryophila TaxID=420952 RepID=UPI00234B62F8|nr:response regulator [Paraburkholderia bryophila]WCM22567.1 LuxR C-terminal-related transcriptional regulator [Paraburkholderia bryophila]